MKYFWLALVAMSVVGCAQKVRQGEKANVVFILADDLGYADVGCYGAADIKTPNIDRLRREGVKLTDFYSNGPVCTPTRCGLMTGRYQQRIGGLEWAIHPGVRKMGLPDREKTIADMLKDAGYATAMSGKWHLGYDKKFRPMQHGFERYFGLLSGNHDYFTHRENNGQADLWLGDLPVEMEGYSTHLITQHTVKFMEEMKERPFFLYVAYNAPHFPYEGPNDRGMKFEKAGDWSGKGSRKIYAEMVEEMDKGIGEILGALDRGGLAENTLVVFASDNGGITYSNNGPLAKKKGDLWEGGIRVPCVARLPGIIAAGSETKQVGITMDWTATIAGMAGVLPAKDRGFDGMDLMPVLTGREAEKPRTLFWRRVDPKETKTHRAVRDGNWKFIETVENGQEFLYDLGADIGEKKNLAMAMPERCAAMKKMIQGWEKEISPPLYPQSGRQVE
ncbi:MAG TPA: sulfatase-like hydrolase/transferase [Tepidisphaeraceae bacterium]|jgi:arylsulfatase A-like enzyme|nr:sulfatase-like hydrolase/transferase [Tepidisphaeraceae bacterium]